MKLEFKGRNPGVAEEVWPKYRIETPDGTTVAEVFGDANQDLGRVLAAAPELLEALRGLWILVGEAPFALSQDQEALLCAAERALTKATGTEIHEDGE